MLSRVLIQDDHVHRIRGEAENPSDAASEYEKLLTRFFALKTNELPRFDFIFLGMGEDGHSVSLFPGTAGVSEIRRMVMANYEPKLQTNRISLTLSVLNNASLVVFLVAGERKAKTLRDMLSETERGAAMPAGMVSPATGNVFWLVDRCAAKYVRPGTPH